MQFLRGADVLLGSAVTAGDMGRVIFYLTPHFVVMALPIAFLLCLLLGLGRLSEDRELIALQALGVGHLQLLILPLALAVLLGALMLAFSFSAEPWGLTAVKGVVNDVIKRNVADAGKPGGFDHALTAPT